MPRKPPTEKTPKTGFKVPVPKRGEVLSNLDKIAKGGPRREKPKG
jgi:hypothetical protein